VIADKRNKRAGELKTQRMMHNPDGTERVACAGDHIIKDFGSRTNVWRYPIGGSNTATDGHISSEHKARMPESVAEGLIISFSKPNDLVFDPFAGAGTTLKMALLNNRQFLGMEVSAEYVEIIRRRLEHAGKKDRRKRLDSFLSRFSRPESAA
jgi:site-specific DNA-methyltransferase (adenine-specific)